MTENINLFLDTVPSIDLTLERIGPKGDTGTQGPEGEVGPKGDAGITIADTEPAGTDGLWADTSVEGAADIPVGGTTGQVLTKLSNTDFNIDWVSLLPAVGYANHGADNTVVRPTGYSAIIWVGSVEPSNAIAGDIYIEVSA